MNQMTDRSIDVDYRQDTGELIFGTDAGTQVGYQLYDHAQGLMCSGAILGRAGTGKTTLLRGIATAVTTTGHTQVWTGQAYNHEWSLTGAFYRAIGGDSVRQMLTAATDILAARRGQPFRPSLEHPGVLVLLDDAGDLLADDDTASMIHQIATNGPAVGVAVLAAALSGHMVRPVYRRQTIILGPMPRFDTDRPCDGHVVINDADTDTATPFAFNWQS